MEWTLQYRLLALSLILLCIVGVIIVSLQLPLLRLSNLLPSQSNSHRPVITNLPPQPGNVIGTGNDGDWAPLLSDDFTGNQLDPMWRTYNGPYIGGTSYYTPDEVQIHNGLLRLGVDQKNMGGRGYISGGIGAFQLAQIYGKYEFRAKLPRGKGISPYAFLWPTIASKNVEVDIFASPSPNKNILYFINHGGPYGASNQLRVTGNFADDFHIFTCEWTPGKLRYLVDGVDQGTITTNVPDQSMWFEITVGTGDALNGLVDATTALPASLDLDWVHIYRYTGS